MEKILIIVCLSLLPSFVLSGGPAISNAEEKDPYYVKLGAKDFQLKWNQDTDNNEGFNTIAIKHMGVTTREIGRLVNWTAEGVIDGYNISAEVGSISVIILTIHSVSEEDGGDFVVTASKGSNKISATLTVDIIKSFSAVHLKLGDNAPISTKPAEPIEINPGSYPVKCIAEGSRPPAAEVKLQMDGNDVTLGIPRTEKMEGSDDFRTTAGANVTFPKKDLVFELECSATDRAGTTKATKLSVTVKLPEVITCEQDQVTAEENEANVTIRCSVDPSMVNISRFELEIGNTGEMVDKKRFVVEDVSPTEKTVTVILETAESKHFDDNLYLVVIASDGSKEKEAISLKRKGGGGGDGDGGACLTVSVGLVLAMGMSMLWNLL